MIVLYRTHFHVVVIVSLLQCDRLNSDWIFHYDKMKWGGSNIIFRKCTLSQSDVFPHLSTPHSFKLLNIMIPYFYLSPSLPPSLCPLAPHPHPPTLSLCFSLIFLSLTAQSQSEALISISDEMIALLSRFFFSPPLSPPKLHLSPHSSCHRNRDVHVSVCTDACMCVCICLWVSVFQSIPSAELDLSPKLSQEGRCVCVCILLASLLHTSISLCIYITVF